MEGLKPIFEIPIAGMKIGITISILFQWFIMLCIIIITPILTKGIKTVPKGKQIWVEVFVEKINGLVKDSMGEEFLHLTPYFGSLIIFILSMNLFGLTGLKPPTTDISVTAGLAIMSFFLINGYAMKRNGVGHYFKGFTHPFPFMLPLNIIDKFTVPVSLCLRLFGNMFAAFTIVELLYKALAYFSSVAYLHIPIAHEIDLSFLQLVLPIPFHLYFDLFDGSIQMFIFVMLTMIFIKTTSEEG